MIFRRVGTMLALTLVKDAAVRDKEEHAGAVTYTRKKCVHIKLKIN